MPKKETFIEIELHKTWNSPQELFVQHFVFDEIKKHKKMKKHTVLELNNSKTKFNLIIKIKNELLNGH